MSITDRYLLDQLVDMAAEGDSELTHPKEAHATDELVRVAYEFEEAIEAALHDIAAKYPPMDGATAQDLIDEEGPYLVYMTLVGAGVGIWDGDWDQFYSREELDTIGDELATKLHKWADVSGGGKFNDAIMTAAYETGMGKQPARKAGKKQRPPYLRNPEGDFSRGVDTWFDAVALGPKTDGAGVSGIDELSKLSKLAPSMNNFWRFAGVLTMSSTRAPWVPQLAAFVHDIGAGKFRDEFRYVAGPRSRASQVGELFSLFQQALRRGASKTSKRHTHNWPKRAGSDAELVEPLIDYIDNTNGLAPGSSEGQGKSIRENLLKKMKKGSYDPELAWKGWLPVVEQGARELAKAEDEYEERPRPGASWATRYTPATRELAAREMAKRFEQDVADGQWD